LPNAANAFADYQHERALLFRNLPKNAGLLQVALIVWRANARQDSDIAYPSCEISTGVLELRQPHV
jgi:hypothetical protein